MKRNDIGDSYLLWLLERVLATRGVHPRRRTITPPHAGKHSAQPSRMPARQPLEMPSRYRFYSTRPADFLRKANIPGVTRRAFAPAARQGGRSRWATEGSATLKLHGTF